ncbi:MAG: NusG domain II-containing protein [Lachnospiraceae bacterium]|nr:NusG domain II-containing protein [Lachnospiraceae bacterium]
MTNEKKRTFGLFVAVLLAAGAVWLLTRTAGGRGGSAVTIRVEADGAVILEEALDADARFVVADGTVRRVRDDRTTQDLLEDAAGQAQAVNIIELRGGKAYCAASNCPNQICVHTQAITREAHDTPIVCLPHRLTIYAVAD